MPSYFPLLVAAAGLLATGCARPQYFQPDARPDATRPLPAAADSVRGATAGRQYARHGRLYGALVGQHHRRSWGAPVSVPVLDLATAVPGGLRPGKLGGGFNSTSLELSSPSGRHYVLRTVDKDPSRAIPLWLRGSFLTNALRDNISATNPYAALTVPPLAAAVGVPATQPQIFYLRPDNPLFAPDSMRYFRGQLGLLEEKFNGPAQAVSGLGTVNVFDSDQLFQDAYQRGHGAIDQRALLRARLFDAWLGDWDRHAGQWNWIGLASSHDGALSYHPLPKDRDMVFYRLDDGLVGWLVGHVFRKPWNTFGPRFTNARGLMSNGEYLDVRGLNALRRRDFQLCARQLQQALPDSLIERALRRLPPAVRQLEGQRFAAALQARRAALPAFADQFYLNLARRARVGGSAYEDRFVITRYADSTRVEVLPRQQSGPANSVPYRRTFYAAETSVIELEGLGGDDLFQVIDRASTSAEHRRNPRLQLYGDGGNDSLDLSKDRSYPGLRFHHGSKRAEHAWDRPPES